MLRIQSYFTKRIEIDLLVMWIKQECKPAQNEILNRYCEIGFSDRFDLGPINQGIDAEIPIVSVKTLIAFGCSSE